MTWAHVGFAVTAVNPEDGVNDDQRDHHILKMTSDVGVNVIFDGVNKGTFQ